MIVKLLKVKFLSITDTLQVAFNDAEKLIEENTIRRITWQSRQTRLETNWEGFRAQLAYDAICQESLPLPQQCSRCSVNIEQSIIRCVDCGPGMLFCSACDIQAHKLNAMHDRCMEWEFFQSNFAN